MHQLEAKTNCSGGPCPDLTRDRERGKIGGQGYVPPSDALSAGLPATPPGEVRWEMDEPMFEDLLAQILTDDALERIVARRQELAGEATAA